MKINWTAPLLRYELREPPASLSAKSIATRLVIGLIAGLWMAFLPVYLFVIYMLHEKFFSYEFFSDGVFGLKTFLFVLLVLLAALAFYLWGFLLSAKLAFLHHTKTGKFGAYRLQAYLLLCLSLVFHLLMFEVGSRSGHFSRFPVVSGLGLVIILTAYSMIGPGLVSKLSNWLPSFFLILTTATLPAIFAEATSDLVGIGLANFNVGGGVNAKVVRIDEKNSIVYEGQLLLLTPRNAYFREGKRGYRVVQQSESVSIIVGGG